MLWEDSDLFAAAPLSLQSPMRWETACGPRGPGLIEGCLALSPFPGVHPRHMAVTCDLAVMLGSFVWVLHVGVPLFRLPGLVQLPTHPG